jgi:hypothetical protein
LYVMSFFDLRLLITPLVSSSFVLYIQDVSSIPAGNGMWD